MMKVIVLIVSLVMIVGSFSGCDILTGEMGSPVEFVDEGFEEAVRDYFNLEGEIYPEELEEIDELNFSGVGIESLEDLKWFTGLDFLSLTGRSISGDLSALEGKDELAELYLYDTAVNGDLSSLSGLEDLGVLSLNGVDVHGDISHLSGLVDLEGLMLVGTAVTGDLASIRGLQRLNRLVIGCDNDEDRQISGDLESLSGMKDLFHLLIYNAPITGDINSLSDLDEMSYISLIGIEAAGDIESFSTLDKLDFMRMASLPVTGDLYSLRELFALEELILVDMDVTGDISILKELENLRVIILNDTDVFGNVESLDELRWLEEFEAEGTVVEGTITLDILDIPIDEEIVLYYHGGRVGIVNGTTVKELYDHLMAIDGVTEVEIWHDDGSNPSEDVMITDYHNMTVHTDERDYLVRIDVEGEFVSMLYFILGDQEPVEEFKDTFLDSQAAYMADAFHYEENQLNDASYIIYLHIKDEEYPDYFMDYFPDINVEDENGTVYRYVVDEQIRILIIGDSNDDLMDVIDSLPDDFLSGE